MILDCGYSQLFVSMWFIPTGARVSFTYFSFGCHVFVISLCHCNDADCIYPWFNYCTTTLIISMATGSIGMYRGVEDTPETTRMLAKEEVENNHLYDNSDCKDSPDCSWTSKGTPHSSPHCMWNWEKYCLIVSIHLESLMDETAVGVTILACALTENIKMYLSSAIPDIAQVVMLGNADFLV